MIPVNRARREAWKIGLCAGLMILATAHCDGTAPAAGISVPLPEQSAGVFIGVEKFSYDPSLSNVDYAVNDAIDLAYSLSIERGVLPANRVLLLLSGEPERDSHDRLKELIAAGAKRESARQADIYSLVEEQSRLVGEGGILVVSIATHGISDESGHLLMAEDSLFELRTGVTAEKLLQATQAGYGGLRILFVDACREQFLKTRGNVGKPDSRSAMRRERIDALAANPGYAVFSAASVGEVARSGNGNGFFTGAIVAGLKCAQNGKIKTFLQLELFVQNEVAKKSSDQHPSLLRGGGIVDFALPPCDSVPAASKNQVIVSVSPAVLAKIESAENLFTVGGMENVERSFRLYKEAFEELPPAVRATLNQGLVNKATKLEEDSQRAEGIQLYQELLVPLVAQSRANPR